MDSSPVHCHPQKQRSSVETIGKLSKVLVRFHDLVDMKTIMKKLKFSERGWAVSFVCRRRSGHVFQLLRLLRLRRSSEESST